MSETAISTRDAQAVRHSSVEFDLVRVRLHDPTGDDLGTCELPDGWVLEHGDELVDEHERLVRVVDVVLTSPGAAIAALVKVTPAPERMT